MYKSKDNNLRIASCLAMTGGKGGAMTKQILVIARSEATKQSGKKQQCLYNLICHSDRSVAEWKNLSLPVKHADVSTALDMTVGVCMPCHSELSRRIYNKGMRSLDCARDDKTGNAQNDRGGWSENLKSKIER